MTSVVVNKAKVLPKPTKKTVNMLRKPTKQKNKKKHTHTHEILISPQEKTKFSEGHTTKTRNSQKAPDI